MEKKIITISREFGSGGRTVGRLVAEKLGIAFYDKELVQKIAVESGFAPNFIEENVEHTSALSFLTYAFSQQTMLGAAGQGMSTTDYLWSAQCKVILELAEKGPCVIVGRNADNILKDRDDCLHVYIHADMDFRTKRIVHLYGSSNKKTPEARLAEKDRQRRSNYHHYTGKTWGDAHNYDICLCTSTLGIENCADMIVNLLK